MIHLVADSLNLRPGRYELEDAKFKLNELLCNLVTKLEKDISNYNVCQAIPVLIENIDAINNKYEMIRREIGEANDQEVEYNREEKYSEEHTKYINRHKNNRYLIEKFIQLKPNGSKELSSMEMQDLLALVDRILHLYSASDAIHYGLFQTAVIIDSDILVSVEYGKNVESMQLEFTKEQGQIELEIVGNKEHLPELSIPLINYLNDIDEAFLIDFGFGFRDMVNVQQVLSLWPEYNRKSIENTYYHANFDEISKICGRCIQGFESSKTQKILHFLTLKPNEMLTIVNDPNKANDLPVWEHYKRPNRYSIKPIIKIGNQFYWGPYSVYRSGLIWSNIPNLNRLPADIAVPSVSRVLVKGHQDIEKSLQELIYYIAKSYSIYVELNVYPHRLNTIIEDIGDIDVLVYIKDKNIILNIESKIIDAAYCLKDLKRVREKIFGSLRTDGSFKTGYLQKVEKRHIYLEKNYPLIMNQMNWDIPIDQINIISLFVTQIGHWWTKFPPVKTDIKFVEIRLLDDFFKAL